MREPTGVTPLYAPLKVAVKVTVPGEIPYDEYV
jgi:hypothetical protein